MSNEREWHRVGNIDLLLPGEVKEVTIAHTTVCLARTREGEYGAICNNCLHQGGPLGEGYINDDGYVVCPWHGWEFHPVTGEGPPDYADENVCSFDVETREDGIYVGLEPEVHPATLMTQVVDTMIDWGIDTVFGMVGHSNLGLANALKQAEDAGRLKYVGVRHEGAAAFAASGYAKLTGRPAACFAIAGPGATNLMTGLWDAKVDRVPILALAGQVRMQVLGPGAFQEVPLLKAFEAVSEWSQQVMIEENASELMALAVKNAIVKRDVSTLIFPDDMQTKAALDPPKLAPKKGRIGSMKILPSKETLDEFQSLLTSSTRTGIILGQGGRNHAELVLQVAKRLNAPVITTFKAKGAIDERHPLACGVLGRSGTLVASSLMKDSDLLIVIGSSFSNHTGIDSDKTIVQIDFDPLTLGKFHAVSLPVFGEIGETLQHMLTSFEFPTQNDRRPLIAEFKELYQKKVDEKIATKHDDDRIANPIIFRHLQELVPDDVVISVDVGNNTYAFGMYYTSKRHALLMSGYLGSIGFAFPAAMGAWSSDPSRKIIAIAGDGGFGQYAMEFTTAVKYNMNITLILLNNSELGKISREQKYADFHVWSTSLVNPNFAEFATSCGGLGIRVTEEGELDEAISRAIAHTGPSLVEIISSAQLS